MSPRSILQPRRCQYFSEESMDRNCPHNSKMADESRVNVWGDEWITYDDVWSSYKANAYWDNVLVWLSPECPRAPFSGCP